MQIAMDGPEVALLSAFLQRASNYLEFGTGGSTVLASRLVSQRITSIDSSQDWLDKVQAACEQTGSPVIPDLVFVNIGPTRAWGFPTDPSTSAQWPAYYEDVWQRPATLDADVCLVDGRFRLACFLNTLLRCKPDTLVAIHDFNDRPYYHVIRELAREVAIANRLSVFLPDPKVSRTRIAEELARSRMDPR